MYGCFGAGGLVEGEAGFEQWDEEVRVERRRCGVVGINTLSPIGSRVRPPELPARHPLLPRDRRIPIYSPEINHTVG